MPFFVHESSIIDEGVQIGDDTKIWHFCHVCRGAQIGRGVVLGQNVYVGGRATVGDRCKIQNNVSIYDGVKLETGVFCGPSVVFTNVHNPRADVQRKDEYRTTLVKNGASLGANCTVVCGVTVGAFGFVGAGAVVTEDVPDYALVVGVPARRIGWISEFGEKLDLPIEGHDKAACRKTGHQYLLDGEIVRKC